MPLFRGTFFFEDTNKAGWSETIYNTAADMTTMVQRMNNLIPLRVALLGSNSAMTFARASDDLVKRDSQVIYNSDASSKNTRGSISNFASDDVVVRLEGNATPIPYTVRRTLAVRGSPVNITGAAGVYVGTAAWQRDFNRFIIELGFSQWAIKYRSRLATVFNIVNAVQALPSGIVTVTTALAHGFNQGDTVKITGVQGSTEINGLWKLLAPPPTPTSFTITLSQLMAAYFGGGTVNINQYALATINNFVIVRCATHKAGRPTGLLVGRRRVRRQR
jgi:hypothetical protein